MTQRISLTLALLTNWQAWDFGRNMKLKKGDYVKILKNGDFFKIVQIKSIYGDCIETSHGLYNRTTLASRLDNKCTISSKVSREDQNGVDGLGGMET
nr:MAG TPA: hypothetical protein [Caudoviricetes sp.]